MMGDELKAYLGVHLCPHLQADERNLTLYYLVSAAMFSPV
jgi:hypothetical protein